jgi:hypothetical protein
MDEQQGHAAWICSKDMQHEKMANLYMLLNL